MSLTLQLVDSICACCRITVFALKCSTSLSMRMDQSQACQTYLGILDCCRGFLSILSSSQQLSRTVRKRYVVCV